MSLATLIDFYHHLTPDSVARFPEFYSAEAYFKDPFNEVRGVAAIQRIFTHMFSQVGSPRFVVTEQFSDGNSAMLVWEFSFLMRLWRQERPQILRGTSHLKFDADGKVSYHRDYWDSAEELYMKLPGIGAMMRAMRGLVAG